jgi:hypothetical protein
MRYLSIQVTNQVMPIPVAGDLVTICLANAEVELVVVNRYQDVIELEVPDHIGVLDIPAATLIRTQFATFATNQPYYLPEESLSNQFIKPGVMTKEAWPSSPFGIDWPRFHQEIELLLKERDDSNPDPTSYAIGEKIIESVLRPLVEQFVGRRTKEARVQMKLALDTAILRIEQEEMMAPFIWEQVKEKLLPVAEQIITRTWEGMPEPPPKPEKKEFKREPLWDLGD